MRTAVRTVSPSNAETCFPSILNWIDPRPVSAFRSNWAVTMKINIGGKKSREVPFAKSLYGVVMRGESETTQKTQSRTLPMC